MIRKGETGMNEHYIIPVVTVFDCDILIPTDDTQAQFTQAVHHVIWFSSLQALLIYIFLLIITRTNYTTVQVNQIKSAFIN